MIRKVIRHSLFFTLFLCSLTQALAQDITDDKAAFQETYDYILIGLGITLGISALISFISCFLFEGDTAKNVGAVSILAGVYIALLFLPMVLLFISWGYDDDDVYSSDNVLLWFGWVGFVGSILALVGGLGLLTYIKCTEPKKPKKQEEPKQEQLEKLEEPEQDRYRDLRFDFA